MTGVEVDLTPDLTGVDLTGLLTGVDLIPKSVRLVLVQIFTAEFGS